MAYLHKSRMFYGLNVSTYTFVCAFASKRLKKYLFLLETLALSFPPAHSVVTTLFFAGIVLFVFFHGPSSPV